MSIRSDFLTFVCDTPPCPVCGHPDMESVVTSIGYRKIDDPPEHNITREWQCCGCGAPMTEAIKAATSAAHK